jgi:uncharacterized protein YgbK (DUF1537 family)
MAIRSEIEQNGLTVALPTYFIPSFLEAGRFTIENIHYLKDGDKLIPVSETEFARDNVFGYINSNLTDYIVEKTDVSKEKIASISINELRTQSVNSIVDILKKFNTSEYAIVNAIDYFDLYTFALSLLKFFAEANQCLVLRTSSSLPKAISGIVDKPLLTRSELVRKDGPGIFIVGSHVKKTSIQLGNLLQQQGTIGIELHTSQILNSAEALKSILQDINTIVAQGKTPVLYTSREEIRHDDKNERLEIGKKISDFIVNVVQNLPFMPAYLVAKGGITSHDILTKGLMVQKAQVMGQVLPGVPVITTDASNSYPNLPYIIFPGNVGDENALVELFRKLR